MLTYSRLGFPSDLFPSVFPAKTLYAFRLSAACATFPAYLILFNLVTVIITGDEYKLLNFSLRNFLHPSVTSSLFGPHSLLSTLFSNISVYVPSERPSFIPIQATDEITVLYISISTF
jgi:hypothetical protein